MRKAAGLFLLLAACTPDNTLGGSVSALFPLTVSRVDIFKNDEAIQISYFNNNGADVDLVARVTVALTDIDFAPGKNFPLEGEYAPGHPRTTVGHQRAGEPERLLAPVKRGVFFLDAGGNPDERTRGSFSMLFETTDDYGGGRDLTGTFSQVALDAGFDPIVPPP